MGPGRRKFLSLLSVAGLAGLGPANSLAAASDGGADRQRSRDVILSGDIILKAGPYLQSPFPDRITVRWLTHVPCFSWIEYGAGKDRLDKKAETINDGLVQAYNTVHAITIDDLGPGQKYYYRICSKKVEDFQPYQVTYGDTYLSDAYSFETPDPHGEGVSFLIFNDIHDRPESFPLLLKYQGGDKKDFVFLNGDMFDFQTGEDQLVDHLLTPFAGLSAGIPFFFSRGNHEMRGKFARHLPEYFNSDSPEFYFSFQWGPVYAIVLDSGEDKNDDHPQYFGLADFDRYRVHQAEWLKKEVEKPAFKKAKYKIVFSHIPLYHAGDWHGTNHCRESWGTILNEAKIDLLISGHTHVYGIHSPVKGQHNYPVVIGGGPQDGKRTIIRVNADRKRLNLEMLDDGGRQVGQMTI